MPAKMKRSRKNTRRRSQKGRENFLVPYIEKMPPKMKRSRKTQKKTKRNRRTRRRSQKGGASQRVIIEAKFELLDRTNINNNANRTNNSNNNNNRNNTVNSNDIIEWFKLHGFMMIEEIYGGTNPKIEHSSEDTYIISYTPHPANKESNIHDEVESIVDFDEDGNYPIEKGGRTYLVAGEVVSTQIE